MAIFNRLFGHITRRAVRPTETVGVPGTAIIGGFIEDIESNQELSGRRRYRTFSEVLANTSVVAAGTRYFLNLISKASWKVEPADQSPRAVQVADAIEAAVNDMQTPWFRVVRRAAMHKFYGFSIQEWTAKNNPDGSIGYLDIAARPQQTIEQWDVTRTGEVMGVVQRSPVNQEAIFIPRSKLVYLVDDALTDNPEGLGLFRHVVQPSKQLSRLEQLEGYGFETDLRGVPVGRAPIAKLDEMVRQGRITEADKARIIQPLADFISKHIKNPSLGLLLDSVPYKTSDDKQSPSATQQWSMELLRAGSTSQEAIAAAIQRKNREIARILGVETLLLGESGAGSLAMARDKSDNFALVVDSAIDELVSSFDTDVVRPLMELNGWPDDLRPKFRPSKIQHRDVTEVTQALKDMAAAGAILAPDDPAIDEVRDLLGLSKQEVAQMFEMPTVAKAVFNNFFTIENGTAIDRGNTRPKAAKPSSRTGLAIITERKGGGNSASTFSGTLEDAKTTAKRRATANDVKAVIVGRAAGTLNGNTLYRDLRGFK